MFFFFFLKHQNVELLLIVNY